MKFLLLSACLILGLTMHSSSLTAANLSHTLRASSFNEAYKMLAEKIKKRGDLPHVSVVQQIKFLDQLSEFPLGRFLIERGGLNGYWTHYAITYPEHMHTQNPPNALEKFLLISTPVALAMRERFEIFKSLSQKYLHEGCALAAVPSGVMAELLDLDYSSLKTFYLYGVDLDPETAALARNYAEKKGLCSHYQHVQQDAWTFTVKKPLDLITSNGLTIYESSNERVLALYRHFYASLKNSGVLITSFLTPPPSPHASTEWKLQEVNMEHALIQKVIFLDILDSKWQVSRTEATIRDLLKKAGFREIEVFYDRACIFPTVVAKK